MNNGDLSILDNFNYCEVDGSFTWAYVHPCARGISIGDKAGSINSLGYATLCFNGRNYKAHRVAWLAHYGVWPTKYIDHINGNRLDNRISNLRLATMSQNLANSVIHRNNKSGFKGVSRIETRFRAQIKKDGKVIYLGLFASALEAHEAYCEAAARLHGEFARAV